MKIFLTAINAKYIHSNLAVYSLRAYAKDYQDQIVIGEYTINNRVDYILEQIYKAKPDVLCFSCYIWNMDYVEELITEYHKLCPEVFCGTSTGDRRDDRRGWTHIWTVV